MSTDLLQLARFWLCESIPDQTTESDHRALSQSNWQTGLSGATWKTFIGIAQSPAGRCDFTYRNKI